MSGRGNTVQLLPPSSVLATNKVLKSVPVPPMAYPRLEEGKCIAFRTQSASRESPSTWIVAWQALVDIISFQLRPPSFVRKICETLLFPSSSTPIVGDRKTYSTTPHPGGMAPICSQF